MNWKHRSPRVGIGPLALALGALLALGSLPAPGAARAVAGNTLRIESPSITGVAVGGSFTVSVVGQSGQLVSGTSASVVFDKARLQVTALAKGADWVNGGASFAGYPSPANTATFIASANAAGKVPAIAAFFGDGSSNLAAGDHDLLSVTFKVLACGSPGIDLPIGPADGSMIDGEVATYGNDLPLSSTTGGTVSVPCPPTARITALPAWIASNSVPLSWSATPGTSAVASYDVRYRRAAWNGTFGSLATWKSATTATNATFSASTGYTYCFSVLARDTDGRVSPWTAETCTAIPLDDRSLTRSGTWTLGTSSSFFRSTYLRSSSSAAYLTRTSVVAKRIALLATTCSTCGSVKVYWGSTLLKSISLYSSTTVNKKLITVTTFTSARSGTLKIRVTSSSTKKVYIDGVAINRT